MGTAVVQAASPQSNGRHVLDYLGEAGATRFCPDRIGYGSGGGVGRLAAGFYDCLTWRSDACLRWPTRPATASGRADQPAYPYPDHHPTGVDRHVSEGSLVITVHPARLGTAAEAGHIRSGVRARTGIHSPWSTTTSSITSGDNPENTSPQGHWPLAREVDDTSHALSPPEVRQSRIINTLAGRRCRSPPPRFSY
jgi:hypothetical protein